jgi:predicted alpha/beta-fold hydrolase
MSSCWRAVVRACAAGVGAALLLLLSATPALAQRGGAPSRRGGRHAWPRHTAGSSERSATVKGFDRAVSQILALPYQPNYLPVGFDNAFPAAPTPVLNDFPAEDFTTGSIPGSPDNPPWPPAFKPVTLTSGDGARLTGYLALLPGRHPGVLVVHGFNTHGDESVIRWAALLAHDGYDVLAADQRDFAAEYSAGYGYPNYPQTFGWKEAQDVLAAGRYLRAQAGVSSVGMVGFSEGAQNAVLAAALDKSHTFSAVLTFSGPADQDTQIYSTAVPPGCSSPDCTYPLTDALVALVVPPYSYDDPCQVLDYAAAYYHTSAFDILARESAMHAQTAIRVPLLNFYAADDPLVHSFQAGMMAGYERGNPLQRTIEIQRGGHAYYYDRWWQQEAILTYFHDLLPGAASASTAATVNQTAGGAPLGEQTVSLAGARRSTADAQLAPYVCDTSEPPPGLAGSGG